MSTTDAGCPVDRLVSSSTSRTASHTTAVRAALRRWRLLPAGYCGGSAGMAPTLVTMQRHAATVDVRPHVPQAPELPGDECHSLRGADDVGLREDVLVSSPGGLMSAYGDIVKPLECTSTRRRPMPPAAEP